VWQPARAVLPTDWQAILNSVLDSQEIIANKLTLVSDEKVSPLLNEIDEIQKMNYRFQETLRSN